MPTFDYSGVDFSNLSSVQNAVNQSLATGQVLDQGFYNQAAQGLSTSLPAGSTNLFGSGGNSADLIGDLSIDSTHYTHIQSTDAGRFFASPELQQALQATYNNGLSVNGFTNAADALNGASPDSLFGNVSLQYAQNVSGDVYAIVRDGSPLRIFSQVEVQALLDNPNVTSINGTPRADFLRFGDGATLTVFAALQDSSDYATSFLLSDAFVNGRIGSSLGTLDSYFDAAGISTNGNDFYDLAVETQSFANANGLSIQNFGGVTGALTVLEKAGVAGDVVGIAITASYAVQLYNSGQADEANALLQDFAAGLAGGAAGGYAGGAIALAILGIIAPEPTTTAAGVAVVLGAIAGGIGGEALAQSVLDDIQARLANGEALSAEDILEAIQNSDESCFGPEVPIDMWPLDPDLKPGPDGIYDQDEVRAKVWKKPIEQIRVGDLVVSFDDDGNLVPGPVTRTFQNNAKILLDFHGTRVTPGHVYYRPDSKKSYKYETLIDVLRDDGVIKHQDGTLIRATTNVAVDSTRDGFVQAIARKRNSDGTFEQSDEGRIRLGTRFLVGTGKERKSWAVADLIEAGGGVVGEDELIRVGDGEPMPFLWDFGETLPKPEDFVLACSGTTLEDIYKAAEWESQGPRLPAPMVLDRGPVQPLKGAALSAMPRNEPLDVVHSPMDSAKPQRTLNRKQRKAMEAKQRKAAKSRKRIAV